ncbi:hypothetical protein, partial [Chromobacterium amazonense]|uniref:hypothetical protein n=1 Tax=Chromobacterium amazonense TaxID=1382803 RepID=UPI003F7A3DE7
IRRLHALQGKSQVRSAAHATQITLQGELGRDFQEVLLLIRQQLSVPEFSWKPCWVRHCAGFMYGF